MQLEFSDEQEALRAHRARHGDKRGAPGMVRLSLGGYNNERDIDAAVSGIEQVVAGEYTGHYRAEVDGSFHPLGYVEPMLFSLDTSRRRAR